MSTPTTLTDERIIEIGRRHFKPDAKDTPQTIAAFVGCVRDILREQSEAERFSSRAVADVLSERDRQVAQEGWSTTHDDKYVCGELANAAACYAANAAGVVWQDDIPSFWPWDAEWWKPTSPRRDLVKAAALIIAEIERIDRAEVLHVPV